MSEHRPIVRKLTLIALFFSLLSISNNAVAQDGKALFQANCASCHSLFKDLTGPGLAGVDTRWPNKELLHLWVKNWNKAVATGDAYAVKIKDWSAAPMNTFDALPDKDIDAILAYIKTEGDKGPPAAPGAGGAAGTSTS